MPILFNVELPSVPLTISRYFSSGTKYYAVSVTSITYTFSTRYDGSITLTLIFEGEKTYDYDGSGISRSMTFGYKIYDSENYVIESTSFYTPSLKVGEKFRDVEDKVYGLTPGSYRVVIIAYQS